MAMQNQPEGVRLDPAGVQSSEMTPEEAAHAFAGEEMDGAEGDPPGTVQPAESDVPEWAGPLPQGMKVPPGASLVWLKIKKEWTQAAHKGDRIVVVWPINEMEERQAVQRARGDQYLLVSELTKSSIRAIDGMVADRTGTPNHPASVAAFWREIGPKGRLLLRTYYTRTHSLTEEETTDFFLHCFATRTAVPL